MNKDISILVGGPAGSGVFRSGLIISKTLFRHGYYVTTNNEYPSIIRGGHQWVIVRASEEKIFSHRKYADIILALDRLTISKHRDRLREKGLIVCDEGDAKTLGEEKCVSLPMRKIVSRHGAPPVAANVVGIGAVFGLLGGSIDVLLGVIEDSFKGREKIAETNKELAREGYDYAKREYGSLIDEPKVSMLKPLKNKILINGNEATALGAISAGLTFYAAYPMTPASPILHFMAEVQKDVGIVVVQPESELAAINMAIGAAYAGARSMVATSGGGFSLMVEALGQAAMTEVPIVIVEAMRTGPSTGLPTYTSQADLRFVMHASQGEFVRAVLAPGDPYEAFVLAHEAMNIAWRYHIPVIVLTDKYLAENYWTVDGFPDLEPKEYKIVRGEYKEGEYKRYAITDDGISPMAVPGTRGALVVASSSEHDERGFASTDPKIVTAMVEKRFRKLKALTREAEERGIKVYGEGGVVVVTWGSTKTAVLEAAKNFRNLKIVQVLWLEPFPSRSVAEALEGADQVLVIENNKTGQLASLLREKLLLKPDGFLGKYDGRPFLPEEIEDWVNRFVER